MSGSLRLDGVELLRAEYLRRYAPFPHPFNEVLLLPFLDLRLRPADIRVAFRMAHVAVGVQDKKHRTIFLNVPSRLQGGMVDGDRVVAVHRHAPDPVRQGPEGEVRKVCLLAQGGGHCREIVHADEQHGQLPHGSEVHRLVERAGAGGAVVEKRHGHLGGLLQPLAERGPDRDGYAPAHDPVGPEAPDGEVGNVHAAPAATALPRLLAEKLRHYPVQPHSLADALPVPPVGRRHAILRIEGGAYGHAGRLLPDAEMSSPVHLAFREQARRRLHGILC